MVEIENRFCHFKHHSLLHDERLRLNYAQATELAVDNRQHSRKDSSLTQTNADQQTAFNSTLTNSIRCETTVKLNQENIDLLPIAMALIKDDSDEYIKIRILLNSGSQACLLSETFTKRYSLNYVSNDLISVTGISTTTPTTTLGSKKLCLFSRHDRNIKFEIKAFVLKSLIASQPSHTITSQNLNLLNGLQLADGNCF
ncbi:hypothetical protein CDAR_548301 [Caerostris darwini]|uniref:Peptidase aspartic putative domain-containing protein n=1 Tax=Caerostris darwini TaxID=1538125 RepID=A0AAV4WC09_9ARAC|nr:hypothetical protein CDAR_548301 [Caerostris darwini]